MLFTTFPVTPICLIGVFRGKQQIQAFYKSLNELLQVSKNEIKSFTADGDKVLVEGSFGGTATATGKPFQTDWVMIWNFADGKVMKHQIFSDTSNIANALRK
jgi:ketosteroid isomerase-like protein